MTGTGGSTKDAEPADNRYVYLVPSNLSESGPADYVDLAAVASAIWQGKWRLAAIVTTCASLAVAYALLATEWYRAEVVLAPASEQTSQGLIGQFGGLAGLAGLSVGGGASVEPVAVLRSREFAMEFIDEQGLLPILFEADWDAEAARWKRSNPDDWPDLRDAVKIFDEKIRTVHEDVRTGLVTLSIEWTDPELAAIWANLLVTKLNRRMRDRVLIEAQSNVDFLRAQMEETNVVTLQQSIGRLLESELQRLMLARGNEEFSFRVIDRAQPPKYRVRPARAFIVVIATFLGGVLGCVYLAARSVRPIR